MTEKQKEQIKKWCEDHKEERRQYYKAYYKRNKVRIQQQRQDKLISDSLDPERMKVLEQREEKKRKWRESHKEYYKQYYLTNIEKITAYNKKYREEHKKQRRVKNQRRKNIILITISLSNSQCKLS